MKKNHFRKTLETLGQCYPTFCGLQYPTVEKYNSQHPVVNSYQFALSLDDIWILYYLRVYWKTYSLAAPLSIVSGTPVGKHRSRLTASCRGISRLGFAFCTLRRFKLAHICSQATIACCWQNLVWNMIATQFLILNPILVVFKNNRLSYVLKRNNLK